MPKAPRIEKPVEKVSGGFSERAPMVAAEAGEPFAERAAASEFAAQCLADRSAGKRLCDELAGVLAHAAEMPGHSVGPVILDASSRPTALRLFLGV